MITFSIYSAEENLDINVNCYLVISLKAINIVIYQCNLIWLNNQ